MKKTFLAAAFLSLCSCASTGGAGWRDRLDMPEKLPGIPKSVLAHCRDESKRLIEKSLDDLDMDQTGLACLDLKLQEDCIERMRKVIESKQDKLRPYKADPLLYRFPGLWDLDGFNDSMEEIQKVGDTSVCKDKSVLRNALNAAQGILGVVVGAGAYDWENKGHGAQGSPGNCRVNCN